MIRHLKASHRLKAGWLLSSFLGSMLFAPVVQANRLEKFLFDTTQNRIEFELDGNIEPKGKIIDNPTRVVIDLPGTVYKGPTVRRTIGKAVQAVRVGQLDADTTRMVIEFAPDFDLGSGPLKLKARSSHRWSLQLPESVAAASQNRPSAYIWPVIGELTSSFGWRTHPITGRRTLHKGIDIAAPMGAPIMAAADGVVSDRGWDEGYGNYVELKHADGSMTFYAHTRTILVSKGQVVKQGQAIAEVGSTGRSTGPHLHFEVQPDRNTATDPIAYLPQRYVIFNLASL